MWRPVRKRLLASTAAVVLSVALASPATSAERIPAGGGGTESQAGRPYTLLLHTAGDFVAQTNLVQCVGASMQMMVNIIEPGADRTARTQLRLQRLARSLSGPRPDGRRRQGASVRGWTAGLNELGAGPYAIVGADSLESALQIGARAIRMTGRPVGLLVWRGRHAWVMTGFRATADPARAGDFRVTAAAIMDPLYPRTTRTWGSSPRPGELLTVDEVGRQFVRRHTSAQGAVWMGGSPMARFNGTYVIVVPIDPPPMGSPRGAVAA